MKKLTIKMNVVSLSVICAIFIVVADNYLFWASLFKIIDMSTIRGIALFAISFIILVGSFSLVFMLAGFKYVFKPLLMIVLFIASIISYFEASYGVVIDKSMMQNIAATDRREAVELISLPLLLHVFAFGLFPAVAVHFARVEFKPFMKEFLFRATAVVITLVITGVSLMTMYKDVVLIGRQHRELRFLITPAYPVYALYKQLAKHNGAPERVTPIGLDARTKKKSSDTGKTIVILVVGETARAAEFSLNGYVRNTNAYLQKDAVISFNHTYACGTSTAESLPCMFFHLGKSGYTISKASRYENLLDVLSHAGVTVLWRDNNSGCKGICSRVETDDMQLSAQDGMCKNGECFDEILLHKLGDYIRRVDSNALIVLHQKGSHGPAYYRRHPDNFSVFLPECRNDAPQNCNNDEILNAYDNTILYTDFFLHKTIDLLKQSARGYNTMMIYVSDHGESLGENGLFLHGLPDSIAPDVQKRIPMIVWISDQYATRHGISKACVTQERENTYSHDNLFHSLLGALDIETSLYKQELDIFASCRI